MRRNAQNTTSGFKMDFGLHSMMEKGTPAPGKALWYSGWEHDDCKIPKATLIFLANALVHNTLIFTTNTLDPESML